MGLFSRDSKFVCWMEAVADLILLNLCWLAACIPVVSAGAATAAVYAVLGRRLRGEGSGTVAPFWRAFRANLKTGTLCWLLELAAAGVLGASIWITAWSAGPLMALARWASVAGLLLLTAAGSLVYPQIARYRNSFWQYWKNAALLAAAHLGWVLLDLVLLLLPLLLFLFVPEFFFRVGILWFLIGFSGLFFLSALIMRRIFAPFEKERTDPSA